jgi:hypothetical protein
VIARDFLLTVPYDFYRCGKCGRLVTQPEMQRAVGVGGTGRACPCGSLRYSPINLPWWGLLLPRVWHFALARVRALGWAGLCAQARVDLVRRLLGELEDPTVAYWTTDGAAPAGSASAPAPPAGPLVAARSEVMARLLCRYVVVPDRGPLHVVGPLRPPTVAAPVGEGRLLNAPGASS